MCRSSRILSFLLVIGAGPALAQNGAAREVGPGAAPSAALRSGVSTGIQPNRGVLPGVRPGIERGIAPNNGVLPGVRSGLGRAGLTVGTLRGRRFGRIRGRGGYGGYGLGLGLGLAGDLSAPLYGDAGDRFGGFDPDFVPAYAPPRCIEPLIISIGRGLRHKAHTRIVYGQRRACVP